MLNEKQKRILENQLYKLVKESFFENAYMENGFFEKKDKGDKHHKKNISKHDNSEKFKKIHDEKHDSNFEKKKEAVLDWLDDDKVKDSELSYLLYPDIDDDSARGLFAKKKNGKREWDVHEINDLYNYINSQIKKSEFTK